MNIFILDTNPHLAAEAICDQHLNKMILESTQMICTALHTLRPGLWNSSLYKPVQPKHPCNKWLIQAKGNMDWLYSHAMSMEIERHIRWRNKERHSSIDVLDAAMTILDGEYNLEQKQTPFVYVGNQVIFSNESDETVVATYRDYYRTKNYNWWEAGKKPMVWTNRPVPLWMYEAWIMTCKP